MSWLARPLAASFSTSLASWQPCPAPRPPPCPQEPDARGPARLATLKFYPYKFPRFSRTHDFLQDLDVRPNPHKTDTVCSSLSLNSLIHCLDIAMFTMVTRWDFRLLRFLWWSSGHLCDTVHFSAYSHAVSFKRFLCHRGAAVFLFSALL